MPLRSAGRGRDRGGLPRNSHAAGAVPPSAGCGGLPLSGELLHGSALGFKRDLNAYLASFPPALGAHAWQDVDPSTTIPRSTGLQVGLNTARGWPLPPTRSTPAPLAAHRALPEHRGRSSTSEKPAGLDCLYKGFRCGAFRPIRAPTHRPRAGYPASFVPAGFVDNPAVAPPPFPPPRRLSGRLRRQAGALRRDFLPGPAFSEPKN